MSIKDLKLVFDHFDTDGNGKIDADDAMKKLGRAETQEEVEQMVEAFDLNGDGEIDFYEFRKMLLSDDESESSEEEKGVGDDEISESESEDDIVEPETPKIVIEGVHDSDSDDEDFRSLFEEFDADGNGTIDRREFKEAFKKHFGTYLNRHEVDDRMSEFDKDGDGAITFEEFKNAMKGR